MNDVTAILGTARSDGNTKMLLDAVIAWRPVTLVDLGVDAIQPYDYSKRLDRDGLVQIVENLVASKLVIFATPVYWYSMSAQLKAFFDRLTDLLDARRDLGRSLHGKRVAVVASGTDTEVPDGFEVPFRRTAEYFEMKYAGLHYASFAADGQMLGSQRQAAANFGQRLWPHAP